MNPLTTPPTTDAPPRGPRDARGRFAKGNLGGPGNPFARQMAAFRQAIHAALTMDDVQTIIDAMLAQARTGNVAAAKLLLDHAAGKPTPAPDPDRLDVDEWKLLTEQTSVSVQEVEQVHGGLPVEAALPRGRMAVYYTTTMQNAEWLVGLGYPDKAAAHVEERLGRRVEPPPQLDDEAAADELELEELAAPAPRPPVGHDAAAQPARLPSPSPKRSNGQTPGPESPRAGAAADIRNVCRKLLQEVAEVSPDAYEAVRRAMAGFPAAPPSGNGPRRGAPPSGNGIRRSPPPDANGA